MIYSPRLPQRLGAEQREAEALILGELNPHSRTLEKCPDCGGKVAHEGGCLKCPSCGWDACGAR
jgi:ribonucleoside-diphosphate reductase alpha chain